MSYSLHTCLTSRLSNLVSRHISATFRPSLYNFVTNSHFLRLNVICSSKVVSNFRGSHHRRGSEQRSASEGKAFPSYPFFQDFTGSFVSLRMTRSPSHPAFSQITNRRFPVIPVKRGQAPGMTTLERQFMQARLSRRSPFTKFGALWKWKLVIIRKL